jgi:hypothetical protein
LPPNFSQVINYKSRNPFYPVDIAMDVKDTTMARMEQDRGSHSGDSEEKGVAPANAYPINDEDYEVTFKTWVVVVILASAYGVCTPLFSSR